MMDVWVRKKKTNNDKGWHESDLLYKFMDQENLTDTKDMINHKFPIQDDKQINIYDTKKKKHLRQYDT